MENTRAVSSRRDMFLDERGTGLRVTWHPERDLVVLSVWQDDRCVGTFRLPVQDVPRLSGLLATALGDWVGQTGPPPGPSGSEPGRSGPAGSEPGRSGPGGSGSGGPGSGGSGSGGLGTVALDTTDPGVRAGWGGGGSRGGEREGREYGAGGSRLAGGPPSGTGGDELSLSVQRRLRLSRPVLKLRELQHRRRRVG